MIQILSDRIHNWNIDIYRNDRNTCPLPFWEAADAPDRKGMTEIRQVEGLYALWDALRQRFPKLVIDNANWRITGPDLEAMTRTIGSLTRSELTSGGLPHPTADQAQTQELSLWIPLDSNLLHAVDPYNFRSTATTGVGIGLDLQSPYVPLGELKKAISELKDLRPYWLGDYYPLTKISLDDNAWSGWQFNRPDLGEGFAVLFRRPKSVQTAMEMGLKDLDPNGRYAVSFAKTYDAIPKGVMTGAQLAHLRIEIGSAPGRLLVRYRRMKTVTASR